MDSEKGPLIFRYLKQCSQGLLDLCNMSEYVSSLRSMDPLLLVYFASHPASSAYEFADPSLVRSARSSNSSKDTWLHRHTASLYRDAQNQTRRLTKLKLIEEVAVQTSLHKAKHYKLTKYGVYCIIEKVPLTSVVVKSLLRYYKDHPLFQYFIYPWIMNDTLLSISGNSTSFFSQLSSYFRYCLEAVKDTIDVLDLTQDNFIWEDIRTGSKDAKALCNFLVQQFGWKWLGNAYIEKSNSNTIEIRGAGSNSVLIRLSDGKAIVSYRGKKQAELPVSEFFHKLIVKQPRQLDKTFMKSFAKTHRGVVQKLLVSIISDESIESDTTRILAQDETFLEAIQDTRSQFEHRYNVFLKTN